MLSGYNKISNTGVAILAEALATNHHPLDIRLGNNMMILRRDDVSC
jgi:hypothetical protein